MSWGYSAKHNPWRCTMKVEKISMFGATTAKLFTNDGVIHVGLKNRKCSKCGEEDCAHVKYVFANRADFEKIGANFNGGTSQAASAKKNVEDKKAAAQKARDQKRIENAIGAKAAADKASKGKNDPIVPGKGGKPLAPEAKAALDRIEKVRLDAVKEQVKAEATMPALPSGKQKLTAKDKAAILPSQKPQIKAGTIKETGLAKGTEVIVIHYDPFAEKDFTVHGFLRKEEPGRIFVERKGNKELVEISKTNLMEIVEARPEKKDAPKGAAAKAEEKGLPPFVEKKKAKPAAKPAAKASAPKKTAKK